MFFFPAAKVKADFDEPITEAMLTEKINTLTSNVRTGRKRRLREESMESLKKEKRTACE